MADAWNGAWGTAWDGAWGATASSGAHNPVSDTFTQRSPNGVMGIPYSFLAKGEAAPEVEAEEEVFSGGYPSRGKRKKTGYELAMEGLARMEYVKPKMRKKGVIEPTNVPITDDTDEDDIKAIMLLIH